MGHIHSIRIRLGTTEAQFEPMRQAVSVLKKFGIKIPQETLSELDEVRLFMQNDSNNHPIY